MKALLIVAHGSRRKQSNDEVIELARALREKCSEQYPIIHAGFLEIADVLIPDGIEKCVNEGATKVIVLPYFLNSGRHVVDDIPEIVNEAQKNYPGIEIKIAPHLGASDLILDLVIANAESTE